MFDSTFSYLRKRFVFDACFAAVLVVFKIANNQQGEMMSGNTNILVTQEGMVQYSNDAAADITVIL